DQTSFSNNEYKVIVELAGVTDINKAIALIGETPLLEFKEQGADTKELTKDEEALVVSKNVTAEKKANEIFAKVKKGDDFAQLAKENSDDTDSKNKGGDLGWITVMTNPQIVEAVKDLKNGDVIKKIIKSDAGYEIIKLVDRRFKSNPFDVNAHEKMINADHILICFDGADNCTTKTTKDEA
ncbi:MAG: peptidylprolyl isomerase, partial [Candidatus Falkowbacteria bacterium]|nr:peptidylprolyl isomerase [Candidatus Falkowbacteria bacterium]